MALGGVSALRRGTSNALVDFSAPNPFAQRLRRTTDLRRHRDDGRPLRIVFTLVLHYQPHRPFPSLRGVSCRGFHSSSFSRVGASGKPGTVQCEAKQLPILVIDEAQHLRNDVLEDLRLLTNFAMDSENRLCLLLVGLTELRRRLAMAVHESLSQRLIVRHHLNGLDRDELDHYLSHRLRLAGCELPLFEPCAVEALFQSTRGLPRLINRIAHYALTAAALGNARTVTAEHLEHAVAELRL